MSDRHPRTIFGAVVVGMLLVLAGCGSDPAPLGATMGAPATGPTKPDADPLAGAPSVGSCFRLGPLQRAASTNTSAFVDCSSNHTAMTYHVGMFPKGTKSANEKRATKICEQKLPAAIGIKKDKRLGTILDYEWFEPTAAQWAAGGRWFRCDLVASMDNKLRRLPTSDTLPMFYDGKVEDAYTRCLDSKGSTEEASFVTCDRKHDYRWAGFFIKPKGQSYPTDDEVQAWSQASCRGIVSTQRWWVTWPGELEWATGHHWVSCYSNTSS